MHRLTTATAFALAVAAPAAALDITTAFRFAGADIVSITAAPPAFDEDPATIEITLSHPHLGENTVLIESDGDVGACVETLRLAQGNPLTDIVLRVHQNAQTLNGVMLVECSTR